MKTVKPISIIGGGLAGLTLGIGLRRLGRRKWTRHVEEVVRLLAAAVNADYVALGGGQTKMLKTLPPGTRLTTNDCAIRGGLKLWEPKSSPAS